MWRRDLLFIDDPVERIGRAIRRIGGEIGGLDLGNAPAFRSIIVLAGTGPLPGEWHGLGLDIHDDAELDVE